MKAPWRRAQGGPGGRARLLIVLSLLLAAAPATWGATAQEAKLTSSDAAAQQNFGEAVAMDGDTVVVGAGGGPSGVGPGAAYVFVRGASGWVQQAKLTASDGASGDRFGRAVAVDGDTVVVGAHSDVHGGVSSGSAYVFVRSGSGWSQQAKLTPSDGQAADRFGRAVAIDRDTVLVGAPGHDLTVTDAGSVYVFTRSGSSWSQQQKIATADRGSGDGFGSAVALDGPNAVIGSPGDDTPSGVANVGSAYVWTNSGGTWSHKTKLTFHAPQFDDAYGSAVALHGAWTFIGIPGRDDDGSGSGGVAVWDVTGTITAGSGRLSASDAAAGDKFGAAVALTKDLGAIGAPGADDGTTNAGAVYLFERSGSSWTETGKLVVTDTPAARNFGAAVGIDGSRSIGGAPLDTHAGTASGSAYVFDVDVEESSTEPSDGTQSDGGTGGDASDDPDDPTPMPSDDVEGQVNPATDEADWWGTEVDAGVADELCFTLTVPDHQDLTLELHAPDGSTVLSVDAGGLGDDEALCYAPGGKLDPGTWSAGVVHVPLTDVSAGSSTPGFSSLDYILGRDCKPTCVST